MKRGTPDHPKMGDLARLLKVPRHAAVGILEMLWHWAGKYAIRGDIGRWPDIAIAEAVDWRGKPSLLIAALINSRWLDESDEFRLLIHDWPDHCEDNINVALARAGDVFAVGRRPKLSKLNSEERQKAVQIYNSIEIQCAQTPTDSHCPSLSLSLSLGSASPKPQSARQPSPILEGEFLRFKELAQERGALSNGNPEDWGHAAHSWRMLDFENREKALADIQVRPLDSPELRSLPANYLKERKFTRPLPKPPMTAVERRLRDA